MHFHRFPLAAALAIAVLTARAVPPARGQTLPAAPVEKIDAAKSATYSSGAWEYRFTITNPGSKSQGTLGELFYAGRTVDPAAIGDYYQTPWGPIQFVGEPLLLWQPHGWMTRPATATGGRALAEPWNQSGAPVVMAMVLNATSPAPDAPAVKIDDWIRQEMQTLNVKTYAVERPWFPLNDQSVTLHDTKMYGRLQTRLLPARSADTLTILMDGSKVSHLDLPRKDGATKFTTITLTSPMDQTTFYLAFRVERAAPAWPQPLDVGPESDGKEIVVKGSREIVIALPGDLNSGCTWAIKSIQGDSPLGPSVRAVGTPQVTPTENPAGTARPASFENTLRVADAGKSVVELEYKRAWQTDAAPEKTFRVTLDVQQVPAPPTTATKP